MAEERFQQKRLNPGSQTGSFINMMMSQNCTLPEVGKGATVLLWTDRHAYEVMEVSDDKKRVVVQQYNAKRIDNLGMSDQQDYEYKELNGYNEVIVWKWGAWRWEMEVIKFINPPIGYQKEYDKYYDENGRLMLVEGVTKKAKEWRKVNILWGVKDEHYDFNF